MRPLHEVNERGRHRLSLVGKNKGNGVQPDRLHEIELHLNDLSVVLVRVRPVFPKGLLLHGGHVNRPVVDPQGEPWLTLVVELIALDGDELGFVYRL